MKERVYLLHGLMGTGETHFVHQIQGLQEQYEVIAVNLPGHGNNEVAISRPFFETTLNWLEGLVKENGKGHVVGLSLGASLGIHLGLKTPELVKSLTLTGYAPKVPDELKGVMEK